MVWFVVALGCHANAGDSEDSAAWSSVPGRYRDGIYYCCAPGEGTSCCPDGTLPDPSTGTTATCFQYGGVPGDCASAGGMVEGKDICALCCDGLVNIDGSAPNDAGDCVQETPDSLSVCAACGDGTCGTGENTCNCPDDCPS